MLKELLEFCRNKLKLDKQTKGKHFKIIEPIYIWKISESEI